MYEIFLIFFGGGVGVGVVIFLFVCMLGGRGVILFFTSDGEEGSGGDCILYLYECMFVCVMEGDEGGRVEYVSYSHRFFEVWLHLYSLLVCVRYRSGENNCAWVHTYIRQTFVFATAKKRKKEKGGYNNYI